MVDSFLLLETGDFLLQEDGSSKLILELEQGGGSGGSATAVGAKSLAQKQMEELRKARQRALGERKKFRVTGGSIAQLEIHTIAKSKAQLQTEIKATSRAKLKIPLIAGLSVAQIQTKLEGHSDVTLQTVVRGSSEAFMFNAAATAKQIKKMEKFQKLMYLSSLFHGMDDVD